jgi:cephalosporin hydroxylase
VNEVAKFFDEVDANIAALKSETDLQALSRVWLRLALEKRYPYNFTWLGRPIIQFPTDILAIQEIIWRTKPDVIVETGIAHGGSLIFSSSMLSLLPGEGRVIGIDIEIRKHNREEIVGRGRHSSGSYPPRGKQHACARDTRLESHARACVRGIAALFAASAQGWLPGDT